MTKRTKKRRWWIWILIALIILAILAFFVIKNRKSQIPEVTVDTTTIGTINQVVSASGKIFPKAEVKISSDVSGEIVSLTVNEGDSVKVGEILATINPESYESAVARGRASVNNAKSQMAMSKAQVENNRAQLEQIKAQLLNARKIHNRNTQLLEDGVISTSEWEASEANVQVLEANLKSSEASIRASQESAKAAEYSVQSAQASLNEMQTNLSRTTIKAPVSGIISLLRVEQGERVVGTIQMSGTEMMRIANLSEMEVQVEVSENNILKINEQDSVHIEVDAFLNRKFKGTVSQIANTASNVTSTSSVAASLSSTDVTNFIVKIEIDPSSYSDLINENRRYVFRPGMSASVEIFTDKKENILTAPIQAVTAREIDEEIKEVVYKVQADSVSQVIVKTGIQDDKKIEILEGLSEGEQIVTGPYDVLSKKLKSGDPIKIDDQEDK